MPEKRIHPRDILVGFLTVFSLCSLILNVALVVHLAHPSLWRDLRLSRLHPPPPRPGDHVRGNPSAPFTVIEYADFQCPYCRQMHAALLTAAQQGKIRWIYRQYPLSSIHPLAAREGEAAECAGEQGKFWEFSDALFARQDRMEDERGVDDQLAAVAREAGADPGALTACLRAGRFSAIVRNDAAEAESLQIAATPTLFIDGKRHEGFVPYDELQKWLGNSPA